MALQQITLLWKGVWDKVIPSLHICLWLKLKLLQSQFVKTETEIRGIRIDEDETKLFQYTDDTSTVSSDIESAHALVNVHDVFKKLSGLVMN